MRRSRCAARASSTPRGWAAASATCSITRPRSGRSSSPRPRTTGSSPSCAAAPPTPACAPRWGAARSSRPPTPSRRCASAASTRRRPPTSGSIDGGSAINVIPERCRIEAEVRSLDADRAATVATEMVDHLQDAANAGECDLDVDVERMFSGYRTKARAPQLAVAERALRACGYEPRQIDSRRRLGRQLVRGRRVSRPRAWPTAPSATTSRASGSAPRTLEMMLEHRDHAGRRGRGGAGPMSGFEADRLRDQVARRDHHRRDRALPPRRRRRGRPATRSGIRAPSGSWRSTTTHVWLTRQPREAAGMTASLEIPAGKLDVPGEAPLRLRAARAGRGDRQAGGQLGGAYAFYTSPGFSDERVWLFLATELSDAAARRRARRGRAHRDRPVAAGPPRRRDRRVPRTPSR